MRNAHPVLPLPTCFPCATFLLGLLCAGLAFSQPTSAGAAEFDIDDDMDFGDLLQHPVAEAAPPVRPMRTAGVFSRSDSEHLAQAYALAHGRLRLVPSCQGLFSALGANGEALLARSLYVQASTHQESRICGRRVVAFTAVGSPVTRLCRNFRRLDSEKGALILIHEALHYAGLSEAPHEPGAPTSQEINRRVAESCGL